MPSTAHHDKLTPKQELAKISRALQRFQRLENIDDPATLLEARRVSGITSWETYFTLKKKQRALEARVAAADVNSVKGGRRLSTFDSFAGTLWTNAIASSPKRRVDKSALRNIATVLDDSDFRVARQYLTEKYRSVLADFNQRNPRKALNTWVQLSESPLFRRAITTRLSRASSASLSTSSGVDKI